MLLAESRGADKCAHYSIRIFFQVLKLKEGRIQLPGNDIYSVLVLCIMRFKTKVTVQGIVKLGVAQLIY
jgi:hypothetical protein